MSSTDPAQTGPFLLDNEAAYQRWRGEWLAGMAGGAGSQFVEIDDLENPSDTERAEVCRLNRKQNLALFRTRAVEQDDAVHCQTIKRFANAFGLQRLEAQRSADGNGVVALEVAKSDRQAGYIPYTDRKLGWHTDGYYNFAPPDRLIRGMLLYCVRDAETGGSNLLLDHQIAYIRLRDLDPAHIEALMHPEA